MTSSSHTSRPSVTVDGPAVIDERYKNAARKAAEAVNPKFEKILDLEDAARITRAVAGFRVGGGAPDYRDRDRLFEAIEALTPVEAAAFGEYRKSH